MEKQKILIVDDEEGIRNLLVEVLGKGGYECKTATNGEEAINEIKKDSFALVLLDILMPIKNGIDVLPQVLAHDKETAVIIVTGVAETKIAFDTLKLGAYDYIMKPFDIDEVMVSVEKALEKRNLIIQNREYQENLEKKVIEQTEETRQVYMSAIMSLAKALEARDKYTDGHSKRVTDYSLAISKNLSLLEKDIEKIRLAALLHDIGKIGVKEEILHKNGSLTNEEYRHISEHPNIAVEILKMIIKDEEIIKIIKHHHERFDGKGVPDGLKGGEIPIGSRIIAVSDSYDAMTSTRPYRDFLSHEKAIAELKCCAGKQFDPKIVDSFMGIKIFRNNPARSTVYF